MKSSKLIPSNTNSPSNAVSKSQSKRGALDVDMMKKKSAKPVMGTAVNNLFDKIIEQPTEDHPVTDTIQSNEITMRTRPVISAIAGSKPPTASVRCKTALNTRESRDRRAIALKGTTYTTSGEH